MNTLGNKLWLKAYALPTNAQDSRASLHIVTVLRAMAENYAAGHPWSEVDSYQVRAAADIIESMNGLVNNLRDAIAKAEQS